MFLLVILYTPSEVEYSYKSNFGYEDISIMSYNLETILAEKLEFIMSKAEGTTRMRDFMMSIFYIICIKLKVTSNSLQSQ